MPTTSAPTLRSLPIGSVAPNPAQPRKSFDRTELDELAQSIRSVGILEPIIVRPTRRSKWVIVSGERRWRAAQAAGLTEIPAIVRTDLDDRSAFEVAMIENVIRSDMSPIEEARGYQQLVDAGMTVADIASRIGKAASSVTLRLSLLRLAEPIAQLVDAGQLDCFAAGHIARLSTEGQYRVMRAQTNGRLGPLDVARLCTAIQTDEARSPMFDDTILREPATVEWTPSAQAQATRLGHALEAALVDLDSIASLLEAGVDASKGPQDLDTVVARLVALNARITKAAAKRRAKSLAAAS